MAKSALSHLRPRLRVLGALILAATLFHLWDGRTIRAREWIRHGEEYVITLEDGKTMILRQQEVRELSSQGAGPGAAPSQPAPPVREEPRAGPRR